LVPSINRHPIEFGDDDVGDSWSAAGKPAAGIHWLEQRRVDYIQVFRSAVA
jgi:hypothetical protein